VDGATAPGWEGGAGVKKKTPSTRLGKDDAKGTQRLAWVAVKKKTVGGVPMKRPSRTVEKKTSEDAGFKKA